MIIKSRMFDMKLKNDIRHLHIGNRPLRFKGSYNLKLDGDFVTDIDFSSLVYFNTSLISTIITTLSNMPITFRFLYLNAGTIKEFIPPWNIKTCNFNLIEARIWFRTFAGKKLMDQPKLDYIYDILYDTSIKLADIVAVDDLLEDQGTVRWSLDDIRKG